MYRILPTTVDDCDTDIVNVKAPLLKRQAGRPRGRYVAGSESYKKKWKKNGKRKYRSDMLENPDEDGDEMVPNNGEADDANGKGYMGYLLNEKLTFQLGLKLVYVTFCLLGGETSKKGAKKGKRVIKCGRCGLEGQFGSVLHN